MADTPSQPPGWPYNEDPNTNPAPPPGAPTFEPPPASAYEPPAPSWQPPPQPAPSYYEPPVPGVPPVPAAPSTPYGGPGQPPPPPGWAPPAPVKKSRRSLWITLAVIFGALVLAIGGCTVWFIGTVTAPVDASNEFLAAIDNGDYAQAIGLTDPSCSAGMSAAELADTFRGADITYNLNSSSVTNNSATVSGSFSMVGENLSTISLSLRNNGGWKVCGFNAN